jgi:DNA-binding XRE family transcriptional regulator
MRLGMLLKRYRQWEEINVRDMAAQLGISAATLSRIEGGKPMDGISLAKILKWEMEKTK